MFCSDVRGQTAYLWNWEGEGEERGEPAESESVCKDERTKQRPCSVLAACRERRQRRRCAFKARFSSFRALPPSSILPPSHNSLSLSRHAQLRVRCRPHPPPPAQLPSQNMGVSMTLCQLTSDYRISFPIISRLPLPPRCLRFQEVDVTGFRRRRTNLSACIMWGRHFQANEWLSSEREGSSHSQKKEPIQY